MADERQDAVTRLCLALAVIDGVILTVTVIIPLLVPGQHAYREQLMLFIWPPFIALFISGIWFVYTLQKIDPDRLQRGRVNGGRVKGVAGAVHNIFCPSAS